MNYIIEHDFNQEIPYYVKLHNDKEFHEIYNPTFATQFNTVQLAKEWVNTYSKMADNSKIVETADAIAKYEKWVKSGTVRRTLNCINLSKSRPYNGESLDEVIDWWIYTQLHDGEIKFEHYTTWPWPYSISKHIFDVNAYHNRAYTEKYITFEIYTKTTGKFEEFEAELNKVIDKVTHKDEDGYLIFPIFDHYLCEHGNSVSLLIHPKTNKVKISGGRWCDQHDYDSLEAAFNYMKKERFYD